MDTNLPSIHLTIPGNTYGFSGTRIDALGSSEYTLVAVAADTSGSVSGFVRDIETCLGTIVKSCQRSSRSDHLMLRVLSFDSSLNEVHGFLPLTATDPAKYTGALSAGGCTALYDAAHNAVKSVVGYGETLTAKHFEVNGVVFVITDGGDNQSTCTPGDVRAAVRDAVTGESLQSVLTVLVGVNMSNAALAKELMDFSASAGFDAFISMENADAKTLGRLASLVTQSISMASSALASGTQMPTLHLHP